MMFSKTVYSVYQPVTPVADASTMSVDGNTVMTISLAAFTSPPLIVTETSPLQVNLPSAPFSPKSSSKLRS